MEEKKPYILKNICVSCLGTLMKGGAIFLRNGRKQWKDHLFCEHVNGVN